MSNEELKDYIVVAEEGITFQEVEYQKDGIISLYSEDAAPLLESGMIVLKPEASNEEVKDEVDAPEKPEGENFGAGEGVTGPDEQKEEEIDETESSLKSYKVVSEQGIYTNAYETEHPQGDVVQLDPTDEQTIAFVESGKIEEVTE